MWYTDQVGPKETLNLLSLFERRTIEKFAFNFFQFNISLLLHFLGLLLQMKLLIDKRKGTTFARTRGIESIKDG